MEEDIILLPYAKKKLYKSYTKLNLENSGDTLYLYYNEHLIDELSRNFQVREAFVITRESLLIDSQKVRVIEVIDGDTVVIEFGDGKKEKVRLIGVDTPETKHPKKIVEFF